ncbi:hypothetical protein CTB91_01274 [Dickeya solani]|uniref:Transposase n=1 Tax=Dickeya solani D s0432-1 TaxID=1231725 RepID=A0AAV3KBY9_9GAMM|nr:hypothetical protein D083_3887 [Dickeya solani RNS 08.23.3.1.A]AYQ47095.1 hypothetical protein CTB91_01274 [Dickeya solani]ERO58077.1 hypothetical protein A544_1250 [Dickeya solani D s0432-1]AYQ51267.1 hypothetical protein DSOL99_01280 [Dickeya solani]MBD3604268.1 hypothetical protein [Dickeya solani]
MQIEFFDSTPIFVLHITKGTIDLTQFNLIFKWISSLDF